MAQRKLIFDKLSKSEPASLYFRLKPVWVVHWSWLDVWREPNYQSSMAASKDRAASRSSSARINFVSFLNFFRLKCSVWQNNQHFCIIFYTYWGWRNEMMRNSMMQMLRVILILSMTSSILMMGMEILRTSKKMKWARPESFDVKLQYKNFRLHLCPFLFFF